MVAPAGWLIGRWGVLQLVLSISVDERVVLPAQGLPGTLLQATGQLRPPGAP